MRTCPRRGHTRYVGGLTPTKEEQNGGESSAVSHNCILSASDSVNATAGLSPQENTALTLTLKQAKA